MQNQFQNKYRIPSARLQTWDYSSNGAYFITICTQNRQHFFGNIHNGVMQLSDIGKFAEHFWVEIPNHFPFVELGNFVIMPNHVHGILIISDMSVETRFIASENGDIGFTVSENEKTPFVDENEKTRLIASLQVQTGGFSGNKNPMINDSVSKIIRWYKGRCSYECRKYNPDFCWQSRFYDHIIRNTKSFDNIQNYIFENPLNWEKDKFYNK